MNSLLAWLRRHKSLAAGVVAAFVVWRVARLLLGATWVLAGWDDIAGAGEWAAEHWIWFAIGLALVFAAVFLLVRSLIPWLEQRSRRA